MKINIISVGKVKESYLVEGILEYKKRISKFCEVNFIEVMDVSCESDKVLKIEGERILSKLPSNAYNIALAIEGEELSSIKLAEKINNIFTYNNSVINFVIGGSLGLSGEVMNSMNYKLSFSKLTFPHQLMKMILLEQIYRSFKILNNETYHK